MDHYANQENIKQLCLEIHNLAAHLKRDFTQYCQKVDNILKENSDHIVMLQTEIKRLQALLESKS